MIVGTAEVRVRTYTNEFALICVERVSRRAMRRGERRSDSLQRQ